MDETKMASSRLIWEEGNGLGAKGPIPDVLEDTEYTVNVIGASSEEEDEIFVRDKLDSNISKGLKTKVSKDCMEDQVGQDDTEGLPIDRGWAWMILAGCFLNVVIMIGYARGLAMLFVEYLKLFEASAAKTTLLMGVLAGVYSLSSLISMNVLINLIGIRKTVLLGATMTTLGMLTAIFPISITYLICTNSVFVGIGHSMIYGPALVLIGQYFNKRRGVATALAMSGISLGSSVFPPLIRVLLDEYGLRGCMIILTGITMNMWVGASLYRPMDFYRKRLKKRKRPKQMLNPPKRRSVALELKDIGKLNPEKFLSENSVTSEILGRSPVQGYSLLATDPDSPKIVRRLSRPLSTSYVVNNRMLSMYASNPELGSAPVLNTVDETSTNDHEDHSMSTKPKNIGFYLKKVVETLDFSLFKKPLFLLVITYSFFGIIIGLLPVYLPALVKEKGIDQKDAAIFLMISGALDFFSRLFYGYFTDLKIVPVNVIMASGLIVTGTVTQFTSFFNSYVALLVYAVVIGLFSSSYFCLIPIAIVDIMGFQNMAKTLGFASVFHGISMAITHPIIGSLKDFTGTYSTGFSYLGACAYVSAFFLLCVPLVRRYSSRKERLPTELIKVTEL